MNHRITRCFARQHAVISRAQALSAGLSRSEIDYRLRAGRWIAVAPRVYALAGAPLDHRSHLMAATLSSEGIASHRSAAFLHGLVDRPPRQPEITIERGRRYGGRAIVHRSRDLVDRDRIAVDRIQAASPARTLLDLGAVVTSVDLEIAFHRALQRQLVTFDDLVARFFQVARRGRDGVGPLRELLVAYDDTMAPAASDLESRLLRLIARSDLPAPVRQHPVSIGGEHYFVDVCYPDRRIVIEGDGFGWHSLRSRFESDRERQNQLVLHGWIILRFTWRQICGRPAYVVSSIRTARELRATA
jgi:very-short-patch-repair endonuclease